YSSRRRHTRSKRDWSSDVCSSDLDKEYKEVGKKISEKRKDYFNNNPEKREEYSNRMKEMRKNNPLSDEVIAKRNKSIAKWREARSEERRVGKEWRTKKESEDDRYK